MIFNLTGNEQQVIFEVWDDDSLRSDDFIGSGVVPLSRIFQ